MENGSPVHSRVENSFYPGILGFTVHGVIFLFILVKIQPTNPGMCSFLPTQGRIIKFPNDRGPHDNICGICMRRNTNCALYTDFFSYICCTYVDKYSNFED